MKKKVPIRALLDQALYPCPLVDKLPQPPADKIIGNLQR